MQVRPNSPHDHHSQADPSSGRESAEYRAAVWAGAVETEIDAETLIHRRATPRKRTVQVSLALLCVLMVVGLLHAIAPPATRPTVSDSRAGAHSAQVSIVANLDYGSVTVNGKKLVGQPPYRFSAAPRGDLVTYTAPPFSPQTCRVFWYRGQVLAQLGAGGSSCTMSFNMVTGTNLVNLSYVLSFQFGLGDLPVAFQSTALDFVRRVITPASQSLAVSTGQYYATGRDGSGMILSRQAATPITAVVSLIAPYTFHLPGVTAWCSQLICPASGISLSLARATFPVDRLWVVQIPLVMNWQFLRPDRQPVGAEHQSKASSNMTVVLGLDARQQWHLAQGTSSEALLDQQRQMIPNILCDTGITELSDALQNHLATTFELIIGAERGLAGCEIHITRYDGTVVGKVVWRLGVLLAADMETFTAYPWLPLAPAAEVAAATGL